MLREQALGMKLYMSQVKKHDSYTELAFRKNSSKLIENHSVLIKLV